MLFCYQKEVSRTVNLGLRETIPSCTKSPKPDDYLGSVKNIIFQSQCWALSQYASYVLQLKVIIVIQIDGEDSFNQKVTCKEKDFKYFHYILVDEGFGEFRYLA